MSKKLNKQTSKNSPHKWLAFDQGKPKQNHFVREKPLHINNGSKETFMFFLKIKNSHKNLTPPRRFTSSHQM